MEKTAIKHKKHFFPMENRVAIVVTFVFFCVYAFSLIFPILWVLLQSFRKHKDFVLFPMDFLKFSNLNIENYVQVFTKYEINSTNVFGMFINTAIVAIGSTLASIASSCVAAYTVSRYKFFGRNFIYGIALFTMIIPTAGALSATYKLMNDSGLAGTHFGLIVKSATGFDFTFIMLYGFFKNLSTVYSEAASIDGAGHFTIFFRIMSPLAIPQILAVSIVLFIGVWNDYINPYLYLEEFPTLSVGIYRMSQDVTSGAGASFPGLFALMTVSIIPVMILFICFQKKIVESMVVGGIKG